MFGKLLLRWQGMGLARKSLIPAYPMSFSIFDSLHFFFPRRITVSLDLILGSNVKLRDCILRKEVSCRKLPSRLPKTPFALKAHLEFSVTPVLYTITASNSLKMHSLNDAYHGCVSNPLKHTQTYPNLSPKKIPQFHSVQHLDGIVHEAE